jgi:general secretion pathway protein C
MQIKRLFLLIDLILITIAVYLCVNGVYAFLASRLDTLPPAVEQQTFSVSKKTVKQPPLSDYQSISKRNLFHTKTDAETNGTPDVDSLMETKANLKLYGTWASGPENSYAIIENDKDHKQNVYKAGDMVDADVKLRLIKKDCVVLSVSGQDEILTLQDRIASTSSSKTSTIRTTSTVSSSDTTARTTKIRLSRTQVDSAMENLTELAGQVTITPYDSDGVQGMKLSNIKANSIFRRMGLRNGDILTAVDGQALTSVDQAYKLYEDLKSSDSASVQIIRRNKTRNYEYTIK